MIFRIPFYLNHRLKQTLFETTISPFCLFHLFYDRCPIRGEFLSMKRTLISPPLTQIFCVPVMLFYVFLKRSDWVLLPLSIPESDWVWNPQSSSHSFRTLSPSLKRGRGDLPVFLSLSLAVYFSVWLIISLSFSEGSINLISLSRSVHML